MTDPNQFGEHNAAMQCDVCEAMCPDAVDGTLTIAEQLAFEKHIATCAMCSEQLAEAKRGAAWMDMLKAHRPSPSEDLLTRILAKTTGASPAQAESAEVSVAQAVALPRLKGETWGTPNRGASVRSSAIVTLPNGKLGIAASMLPQTLSQNQAGYTGFHPRLAMTAAMAFFSIALTMNVLGVRMNDLRPENLRPSALQHKVADAKSSVVRKFENNRTVYQVESRVDTVRGGGPGQ